MTIVKKGLWLALTAGFATASPAQQAERTLTEDLGLLRTLEEAAASEARGETAPAAPSQGDTPPPSPLPANVRPESFSLAPEARPRDVASLDAIIAAFYENLSADAGVERDWSRFRTLFYPGARMIHTGRSARTGKPAALIATTNDYIRANDAFLKNGFHQRELSRHVDTFGMVSHVFSWFEARVRKDDPRPLLRGVNSIQLLNDGTRWWILSIAWSSETSDNPLPKEVTEAVAR